MHYSISNLMKVKDITVTVNLPDAPKGGKSRRLPPYYPADVYSVDEYQCPPSWMNGSPNASSYFIGVEPGKHLWLDFNNLWHLKNDVAIVLSVQGINPITGQMTKNLRLERYEENCPVHQIPFKGNRLCDSCGYRWPAQNYMTTTSWERGKLWIDGFRTAQEEIRGFLITQETMKGVAAQLIGEERVWAIGMAFFKSKLEKIEPSRSLIRCSALPINNQYYSQMKVSAEETTLYAPANERGLRKSSVPLSPFTPEREEPFFEEISHLEIAAGEKLDQNLSYPDEKPLSFYEEDPYGMIYLNYIPKDDLPRLLSNRKSLHQEGFLESLVKGNPAT